MKTLFIIPARGGSKGLPGKNIRPLLKKPLIGWTIEAAIKAARDYADSCVMVSTDDQEIADVSVRYGAEIPFLRPAELATDEAGTQEVLIHALDHYKAKGIDFDTIVLMQATSPLRTAADILTAMELYNSGNVDMVVSVKETKANPYFTLFEEDGQGFLKLSKASDFSRRQDCPKVFEYNGAVYVIRAESLRRSAMAKFERITKYVMQDENSIDIDTRLDFEIAEFLISKKHGL